MLVAVTTVKGASETDRKRERQRQRQTDRLWSGEGGTGRQDQERSVDKEAE